MTRIVLSLLTFFLLVPAMARAQEPKVVAKQPLRLTNDDVETETRLQKLGVKRVPGVEESGFYNTEGGQTANPFRWTNGKARLIVPFVGPPPVVLHVRLGLGVPRPTRVTIQANGIVLFDETVKPQTEWTRNLDLHEAVTKSPVTIEINSDVFIPSEQNAAEKDDRPLGIRVQGLTLITATRDYSGVNLAVEPVPGVDESGFHNRERSGDQPFRWTNGTARVVVPVADRQRWRTLAVSAEIPDRPNYRVKLTVNGRVLFDGVAEASTIWTKEFPLEGIDLGRQAAIELTSSTIAPGQSRTKDERTLGIRLHEMILKGR